MISSGVLEFLGVVVAGFLCGGLLGIPGGAAGGWLNGRYDPIFRIAAPEKQLRRTMARQGMSGGIAIGIFLGPICGAVAAPLSAYVSVDTQVFVSAVGFWLLFRYLTAEESIVGFPGGPVFAAVFGTVGGHLGRVLIVSWLGFGAPWG